MKFNINKILSEWAYRVDDGQPDVSNPDHIENLREILYHFGLPHKFIVEYIHGLNEIDFPDQAAYKAYRARHKMRPTTKVTVGGKETTAGELDAPEDETESPSTKKDIKKEIPRSSTGVHGDLKDGDNRDKHDVLEHGYKGSKEYYKKNKIKDPVTGEIKKPAPGSAGSAFNEIVSGEGIHILNDNPNMSEEELADKMYNEFGGTGLGQEQSYSAQVKDDIPARLWEAREKAKGSGTNKNPENPEAFKESEQQIATYSKCIIVARAAKDKHQISQQRVSNLQENIIFNVFNEL